MGDFNDRFRKLVHELPVQFDEPQVQVSYSHILNPIQCPADNASALFSLSADLKCVILHNIQIENNNFPGNLT